MGSCINPARKARPNGQLHLDKLKGRLPRKLKGVCGRVTRANQRVETVTADNLHLPKDVPRANYLCALKLLGYRQFMCDQWLRSAPAPNKIRQGVKHGTSAAKTHSQLAIADRPNIWRPYQRKLIKMCLAAPTAAISFCFCRCGVPFRQSDAQYSCGASKK